MILIVGLGNPGTKYANTRHNIGFKAVDALSKTWNIPLDQSKFEGHFGKSAQVILAKPSTYMNLSGHFVIQLARYFRIEPPQILLIYDEAALPTGVIKLRQGGSSGGHNGVQNVIDQLGQADFMRLRIGIGPVQGNLENYVLSPFNAAQIAVLNNQKKRLIEMVKTVVDEGLESAMNRFH